MLCCCVLVFAFLCATMCVPVCFLVLSVAVFLCVSVCSCVFLNAECCCVSVCSCVSTCSRVSVFVRCSVKLTLFSCGAALRVSLL